MRSPGARRLQAEGQDTPLSNDALAVLGVAQADLRVDIGMVAEVKGAAADGGAGQSLDLDVRPEVELAAQAALVFDPLRHGRSRFMRPPGQAPEGLVEVYVPIDEGGEEDGVLAVDHHAAIGRGDADGEALDGPRGHQDIDGGSAHGPGVLDEEVAAHSGTLTVGPRQVKGRGRLSCVTFGVKNARPMGGATVDV